MWLARHTPENTMPIIEKVLRAVRETYADTAYDASMGVLAVGYCFGAKYVLRLAATDEIVAGAAAHGLKPGFPLKGNGVGAENAVHRAPDQQGGYFGN